MHLSANLKIFILKQDTVKLHIVELNQKDSTKIHLPPSSGCERMSATKI